MARTSRDAAALARFVDALTAELPPGAVRREPDLLAQYAKDESDTGEFAPDVVVFATAAADVQAVLRLAGAHDLPVTPVGGRSGKSGGCLPLEGGVALSTERMNRIVSLSTEDLIVVVQPGVITGELMRTVEGVGLFYPPDPNSLEFCTIGGNIAENAGGPRALKYGVTRDYVLGMEWVLPSGELIRVGRRTIKGVVGYDLVGLFVGSEGTLGVATEITLQLIPLPKRVMTALVEFPSVAQAARAVTEVLARGVLPRTLELMDDVCVETVDRKGIDFAPGTRAALILEVDGNQEEGLLAELVEASDVCTRGGALSTVVAQDESQRQRLWQARRLLSRALRDLRPFKISEDIAVPRSAMPEFIDRVKALGREHGLLVATYGHAGDGNLHTNVLFNRHDERPTVDALVARMMRLAVELGGTLSGEHGVGYAKREFVPLEQAEAVIDLQRALKRLVDPKGLLNPGKLFPGP